MGKFSRDSEDEKSFVFVLTEVSDPSEIKVYVWSEKILDETCFEPRTDSTTTLTQQSSSSCDVRREGGLWPNSNAVQLEYRLGRIAFIPQCSKLCTAY